MWLTNLLLFVIVIQLWLLKDGIEDFRDRLTQQVHSLGVETTKASEMSVHIERELRGLSVMVTGPLGRIEDSILRKL
jgi:hypothetical protein